MYDPYESSFRDRYYDPQAGKFVARDPNQIDIGVDTNHGFTASDSLVVAETPSWHGWGTLINKPGLTVEEALAATNLDFEPVKQPTYAEVGGVYVTVPRSYVTVRPDTGEILGVVGENYQVFGQRVAFGYANEIVGHGDGNIVSAGSIHGGRTVFLGVRLPRDIEIAGVRRENLELNLVLLNSHDGSTPIRSVVTPVRPECANTASLAINRALTGVHNNRHTINASQRAAEAQTVLGIAHSYADELERVANVLAQVTASEGFLARYTEKLFPLPPKSDDSYSRSCTIIENRRERFLNLYFATPNLEPIRGTAWGVLQATADFNDHVAVRRNTAVSTAQENAFHSVFRLNPNAQSLTQRGFDILTQMR